jgi:hypothetical protein
LPWAVLVAAAVRTSTEIAAPAAAAVTAAATTSEVAASTFAASTTTEWSAASTAAASAPTWDFDAQLGPEAFGAVEMVDCRLCIIVVLESDERKARGVEGHPHVIECAKLFKFPFDFFFLHWVVQATHIDAGAAEVAAASGASTAAATTAAATIHPVHLPGKHNQIQISNGVTSY